MASPAIESQPSAPSVPAEARAARWQRADFEFELPPELIAQHPAARREAARLLLVRKDDLQDAHIPDLVGEFQAGDVLVLNDTRVIKARLRGEKQSGGRVEALLERALDAHRALVLLRTSHAARPGLRLRFFRSAGPAADRAVFHATVRGRNEDLFELEFEKPVDEVLEAVGEVPLPPYIRHAPAPEDAERYQTVYARSPGAVAAPTAGLHLSEALLAQLRARGVHVATVTLHVGAGTFQPVRTENLAEHRMHAERYFIPPETARLVNEARAQGHRVVAVGTTSVRALESSVRQGRVQAGAGETRLFILPGYEFQCVDRLLTNFHLPGSTLLMLVCAFAGTQRIRRAYGHAVAQRYRFFSYGDAMLLERAAPAAPGDAA
jgi:S-adenosylmethionine:tRNA ribosyltransferase-isomerase